MAHTAIIKNVPRLDEKIISQGLMLLENFLYSGITTEVFSYLCEIQPVRWWLIEHLGEKNYHDFCKIDILHLSMDESRPLTFTYPETQTDGE